jgi:L-fuculose-phosphate aldolase
MANTKTYGGGRPADYGTLPVKSVVKDRRRAKPAASRAGDRRLSRRAEVVHYARLLAGRRYVVGADGNVSVREAGGRFLITPTGVPYDRLSAAEVCRLGLDGSGGGRPSSEWRLHAAVYAARPDVKAIVHAHPVHACALAVNREPLPAILDEVGPVLGGQVAVAEYAPSGTADLGRAAVLALAGRQAVLLANHGSLTVGSDLAEAFYRLEVLERAAEVFLVARRAGTPVRLD